MGLGVRGEDSNGFGMGGFSVGHSQIMGDQPCQQIQLCPVSRNPWCVFQVPGVPGGVPGGLERFLDSGGEALWGQGCHRKVSCLGRSQAG